MKRLFNFITSLRTDNGKPLKNETAKYIKYEFRNYFEGNSYGGIDPIEPTLIKNFEITNVQFIEYKDKIKMIITCEHVGLLIGKGGRLINALTAYLNETADKPIVIDLKESKIWW